MLWEGFEPSIAFANGHLKTASLPISPPEQNIVISALSGPYQILERLIEAVSNPQTPFGSTPSNPQGEKWTKYATESSVHWRGEMNILHHDGVEWVRLDWYQQRGQQVDDYEQQIDALTARNAELLEALQSVSRMLDDMDNVAGEVYAAIKAAEGE